MRDELLAYYERELTYLRHMGAEFAEKYPKVAGRLVLEPDRCEDPHVERMLEAFAFLAARVHLKIEDDFPEITNALLEVVYPHYTRPIPSMTVVEFHIDPEQGKLSTGLKIPRGTLMYSRPVDGAPCKFRTAYDTTLWPINLTEAEWRTPDRIQPQLRAHDAAAALRMKLECGGDATFDALDLRSLRFYLNGESTLVHTLYELLCNNCVQVLVRDASSPSKPWIPLPHGSLQPVGFAENEAVLPYSRRSFAGYRLLQEYFAFAPKFLFLQLSNLEQLAAIGAKSNAELAFIITRYERSERQQMLELNVSPKTLRLYASPAINLFAQSAEPILLDQTRYEYPVIPDMRRRETTEIFSVDEVVGTDPKSRNVVQFQPLYSQRQSSNGDASKSTYWYVNRRPAMQRDNGRSDVFLSLVDARSRPARPNLETLTARCTCSNHDLPMKLPFGNPNGDFELEGGSPIRRIVCLQKPTASIPSPSGKGTSWKLISQLSLNYLSLVSEGRESLLSLLRLYNFSESTHLEKQIAGITRLDSHRHFARLVSEYGITAAAGTRVEMELDEEQFVGGGVYLFASVLEHFLGLYASINSFSQLVASTKQRKEVLRAWPPRAGEAILI